MVAVTSAFSCVKRAIRAKQAKCFETPRAGIGPGADGGRSRLSGRLGNGRKERRMRTSAPRFVACEELVWIKADGSETEVSARVGAPYPDGDGAFFCPVELSGVDGRYPDIGGSGSLQALCLAIRLLSTRLGHLLGDGERIVYAADRSIEWNVESLNATFGM
jgi:hypothetical protein